MKRQVRNKVLKEQKWTYELPNDIREFIQKEDYNGVLDTLEEYVEMLSRDGKMDEYDKADFMDDIENQKDNLINYEEYDMTLEDVIDEIDYILDKFYDFCDANRIWINI